MCIILGKYLTAHSAYHQNKLTDHSSRSLHRHTKNLSDDDLPISLSPDIDTRSKVSDIDTHSKVSVN